MTIREPGLGKTKTATDGNKRALTYQAALAELCERPLEEFDEIYDRMMIDTGPIDLLKRSWKATKNEEVVEFVTEYCRDNGIGTDMVSNPAPSEEEREK